MGSRWNIFSLYVESSLKQATWEETTDAMMQLSF
uniref:Uncharacterized protein n=1 Tax=Vitis vinifera TaxID=29760 RepID=F6HT37_VITVI